MFRFCDRETHRNASTSAASDALALSTTTSFSRVPPLICVPRREQTDALVTRKTSLKNASTPSETPSQSNAPNQTLHASCSPFSTSSTTSEPNSLIFFFFRALTLSTEARRKGGRASTTSAQTSVATRAAGGIATGTTAREHELA